MSSSTISTLPARRAPCRTRAASSSTSRCALGQRAASPVQRRAPPGRAARSGERTSRTPVRAAERAPRRRASPARRARRRRSTGSAALESRSSLAISVASDVGCRHVLAASTTDAVDARRRAAPARAAAPSRAPMTSTSSAAEVARESTSRRAGVAARPPAACAGWRVDEVVRSSSSSSSTRSRLWIGLATNASAPDVERALARLVGRDHAHRDVARREVVLEPRRARASPSMSGRKMSSVIAVGLVLARPAPAPRRPSEVDEALEALLARRVEQARARSARSFSTISSTRSPGWMSSRSSPTSLTRRGGLGARARRSRSATPARRRRRLAAAARRARRPPRVAASIVDRALGLARDARRRVDLRQVEREGAALARRARPGGSRRRSRRDELAADRQAQAGAAVLAAGAAVGLLERLEDDLLLVGRDADAGVASPRTRARRGARLSVVVVRAPARRAPAAIVERHLALVRELERVRQQVLEDLLQALGVGGHRRAAGCGSMRIEKSTGSSPRPRGGRCARRSAAARRARSSPTSTTTVPDSIFDRSRMSLMSISRSLPDEWIVFANSICRGDQVAVGVLARAGRRGSAGC